MGNCSLTIHSNGKTDTIYVRKGTNLLSALRGAGIEVSAACGGKGTCGKCIVKIEGKSENPTSDEIKKIGYSGILKGYRLACLTFIENDIIVHIPDYDERTVVKTDGEKRDIEFKPHLTKQYYDIGVPSLDDQCADVERVLKATKARRINHTNMKQLPSLLRSCDYKITVTALGDEILTIDAGNSSNKLYGIAIDIGTTTIAAYLINLKNGEKISVFSQMNPQRSYGADVISRITYTIENPKGLDELNKVILDCINDIISHFCGKTNVSYRDISLIVVVGNTTMTHLLLGLDPGNMARTPFIPVTTSMQVLDCAKQGLHTAPGAKLLVYPCVSAYIGADIIAAILSTGLYESENPCLLLDLGTNGEIALGNKNVIYSCSTAAGPAFEGANIRNGMPGVGGAIEIVKLIDNDNKPKLTYSTIASQKPLGICGSGIVDIVAEMLKTGIINYTGRINDTDELPEDTAAYYTDRMIEVDGQKAFLLVSKKDTDSETDICVTQKDIRELQNAKAAIAAGIRILLKEAGLKASQLERVYLAGGLGSYIDVDNALAIGLIPEELAGKVKGVGNAAGSGAVEGLLSGDMLKVTETISKNIKYIELSARPDFMDEYMECMYYGDSEE